MGGGASVEIAHIFTHRNRYDSGNKLLTRVSTFVFAQPALPADGDLSDIDESAIENAPVGTTPGFPTGKIGILLEANQDVDRFLLLFETLRYPTKLDSTVRGELDDTFGDRKSTRLNSSHIQKSRMPSSA